MDEEDCLKGKIKSVAVKDFVTYDKTIFFPGEHLNIIIGPNGTGKSTIVAGIVLGMGGNCKLLSRSTSITDYIKNGKEMAQIEIHIYKNNAGASTAFNRSFDQAGNDQFTIDGKASSHKEYMRRIKEFNIQIDNLCQFMPQDRVQDFAKMNAQEILKNTQSSVCSADMSETFEKLIEKRAKQLESSKRSQDSMTKLLEAEQRNEELKGAMESMKERQSYTKKLEICLKKKAWMEYEIGYEKFKETETDLKQAKKETAKATEKLKPLQNCIDTLKRTKEGLDKAVSKESQTLRICSGKVDEVDEGMEKYEDQIKQAQSDLKDTLATVRDRDSEVHEARTFFAVLVEDLKQADASAGSVKSRKEKTDQILRKMDTVKRDIEKLMDDRRTLSTQLDETIKPQIISLDRRIKNMENVKQRRLEFLQQNHEDTYKACMWLRQNPDVFHGKVYEPIMMEINVKNTENAKYVENAINNRDLIAFTCECKEDVNIFMQKIRTEMKLNANVVQSSAADRLLYSSKTPIQQLRQYGFTNYLIEMIEGPTPILNFLCQLYNLHNIPIGNDEVYKNAGQVPSDIRSFYSTNHMFRVNISKYSGEKSSASSEIKSKNYLNQNVDANLLRQTKQAHAKFVRQSDAIRNERTTIEGSLTEKQEQINVLQAEKKQCDEKLKNLMRTKEKVERQQQKLEMLEKTVINVEAEKEKYHVKIKRIIEGLLKAHADRSHHAELYRKAVQNTEIARAKLEAFQSNNNDTGSELRQLQDDVNKAKILEERIAACVESTKQDCKKLLQEAKKLTDNMSPNNDNFPYKRQFDALPGDMEEMQQRIDEIQTRLDCMGTEDLTIIEEYKRRVQFIAELREQIAAGSSWLTKIEQDIQQLHNVWYEKISDIVNIINENFSNFMSSMGFAGEVTLTRNEERNYKDYGIQICVKYRNNERLQALDRYVQSGGERAVAIAVYTLSLQHITNVPFRCVDEINQGMDPRNERKIFEMLVDQTCRKGRAQYFFITPKLLPNLAFNDLMTVHIVYNGKFIDNPHMFVLDKLDKKK